MTGGSGIGQSMVQCYPGRCFWGAQVKRRQEQAADNRQQAANNRQQTAGTVGRQQRRSRKVGCKTRVEFRQCHGPRSSWAISAARPTEQAGE